MKPPAEPHSRHRFPTEIISHAVWLYQALSLGAREIESILAQRGVPDETLRRRCKTFDQTFTGPMHRRRPQPDDTCTWLDVHPD